VSAVLADAYSYRLPVVVSDVGPLGETVSTDGTGWVVPRGDATALADAMLRAVSALETEARRAAFEGHIAEAARRHDYSVVGPQYRGVMAMAVERDRSRSRRIRNR
jgi:glycosyltransferase involved in cell wall biosynthesis